MSILKDYKTVLSRYEDDIRINKIGAAWLFSNSEKIEFGCIRKWTYGYILKYDEKTTSDALLYGITWHLIMEHALIEIMREDRTITIDRGIELCEVVGRDYLYSEWDAINTIEEAKEEWIENIIQRLKRAIIGWCHHWNNTIHLEYEIIAIEQTLACPVIDPTTQEIYTPKSLLIKDENRLYPVGINNLNKDKEIIEIEMPYWRVGKADAIVRKRGTKSLYILDHKTTSVPNSYEKKFLFDMQLSSYCALLHYEISHGELTLFKDHHISGVIWDLCHSKVPAPPTTLKSGKLSTAKNRSVPSWIYEESIKIHGLDRNDYLEHLDYLKNIVDHNYFQYLVTSINANDMNRSFYEDYATAIKFHNTRLSLVECSDQDFNYKAPRYPICQQYLSCKYSEICQPNIALSKIDEDRLKKDKQIHWLKLYSNEECSIIDYEDKQISLPF